MKTKISPCWAAVLSLAVLSSAVCGEKAKIAGAAPPVGHAPAPVAPLAQWMDIKDCSYDMRTYFCTGVQELGARIDAQIGELAARRAAMSSTTSTKDWDFAMKEMANARSYFRSTGAELGKATPETWSQQKDKVGLAWVRTQDAYNSVRSSTTN